MNGDQESVPAAEQIMTTVGTRAGDAVVLAVAGEVDGFTVPRLRAALAQALDEPAAGPVVVDLTAVTFLGASGIRALLDAHERVAAARRSLRLVVGDARCVNRPLLILGVGEVLGLYPDLDGALRPGCRHRGR